MGGPNGRQRLPVFDWLAGYDRRDLRGDLVAGLTVGAMLIPQSMGYALLAGLPPQIGLYSAVLPLVVYAAFGWSRQLGVGPTAISSLLTMAVAGLVDVREARRLWTVKRSDFWLLALAFGGTLVFGVELGLGISIVASLAVVLRQTTRPPHRRARADPGHEPVSQHRALPLGTSSVTELDSSADTALVEIADDFATRDIQLYLAGVKGRLLDVMRRSGSYQRLGPMHFFLSADDAVRQAEAVLGPGPEIDLAETDEVLLEEGFLPK